MLKKKKNYLLGQELVRLKAVSHAQIDRALEIQKETGGLCGQILLREGSVTEDALLKVLADQWGLEILDLSSAEVPRAVLDKVPAKLIHYYHVFPVEMRGRELKLVIGSETDFETLQELGAILGIDLSPAFAKRLKIAQAIEKNYGIGASVIERLVAGRKNQPSASLAGFENEIETLETSAGEGSVRELVSMLLMDAKQKRASDIHLEPFEGELVLRYRVDGVLHEAAVPEAIRQFHGGIITRIKIMAQLDISERRLPQDGRIKIRVKDDELDLRISLLPTVYGEALVIRILSPARLLNLDHVGLSKKNTAILRDLLARPNGIILLTGPTGSGKTTTLYAALSEINTQDYKIITVEDPVEYQLRGIIQMQVHPKIGLSFASGLRHMLRHDPDVMMIGEIRDSETAEIAIRSALTGHLVFSTLHTNDAPGAVARLSDLGMAPYLVSSSLNAVIAQRLVRILCAFCKDEVPAEKIKFPDSVPQELRQGPFYEAKGCVECRETGYRGRTAIHEIMLLDEEIREALAEKISMSELKRLVLKKGMTTLLEDGLEKARQGITAVREVLRVARQ